MEGPGLRGSGEDEAQVEGTAGVETLGMQGPARTRLWYSGRAANQGWHQRDRAFSLFTGLQVSL